MHRKEERRLKENQWDEEITDHWSKESPVYGVTKQIYLVKWPNKPYTQEEGTQARTHKMKHKIDHLHSSKIHFKKYVVGK